MANRFLTRQEVYRDICAPYFRGLAKVFREHPLKPGGSAYIPGLGGIGFTVKIDTESDNEAVAANLDHLADKCETGVQ